MRKAKPATSALLPIYRSVDRSMAVAIERHKPPCTKGCAACCELLIVLTAVEADALADRVVNDPAIRGDVEAILASLDHQSAILDKIAVEQGPNNISAFQEGWWQARLPCVLLDPTTKTCRAYEYRPSPCRTHAVVSDPSLCVRREPTQVSHINFGTKGQIALTRALLAAGHDVGLPSEVGTMSDMLASAIRRKLNRPEPKVAPGAATPR